MTTDLNLPGDPNRGVIVRPPRTFASPHSTLYYVSYGTSFFPWIRPSEAVLRYRRINERDVLGHPVTKSFRQFELIGSPGALSMRGEKQCTSDSKDEPQQAPKLTFPTDSGKRAPNAPGG